ncbi:hypothetical protein D6851_09815 [Altericroceibacterium spongiae]|uniref:Uncharacterized protein n=1 Tax=Altericroceibacterium spongiae TaxID=2320269 RepID=A0A420EKS1_9SPHN|nr:hypothetical protein [Altericroceibacterium spongiae]RKF21196.1 hypothetical protein D6851_09815 [Altericroceibacterium spongiae]
MASRYEQAVYDCMNPTLELYHRTENPFHKAILLNFWRHVHLEGAAMFEEITAEDMMSDNPVYRVSWGETPQVVKGREGVAAFYASIGDIVLWNSGDMLAVADWGIADEMWFHQMSTGAELRKLGHRAEKDDGLYLVSSKQAFVWPYDDQARLKGEHLYEDKSTLTIEEIDPAEALTPERVREIHRECLAEMERQMGPEYWVYRKR